MVGAPWGEVWPSDSSGVGENAKHRDSTSRYRARQAGIRAGHLWGHPRWPETGPRCEQGRGAGPRGGVIGGQRMLTWRTSSRSGSRTEEREPLTKMAQFPLSDKSRNWLASEECRELAVAIQGVPSIAAGPSLTTRPHACPRIGD
jgi:hypothetical protein